MSAISEVVGNASQGHSICHKGKTYFLRMLDKTGLADYEKAALRDTKAKVLEVYAGLSDELLKTPLKEVTDDYLAGKFSFLHPNQLALVNSGNADAIFRMLNAIMPGTDLKDILTLIAERGPELMALADLIVHESLPVVQKIPDSKPTPSDSGIAGVTVGETSSPNA